MSISNEEAIEIIDKCIDVCNKNIKVGQLFGSEALQVKDKKLLEVFELCKLRLEQTGSSSMLISDISREICNEALRQYDEEVLNLSWRDAKKEQPVLKYNTDNLIIHSSARVLVKGDRPDLIGIGTYIKENKEGSKPHWNVEPIPTLYYGQFEVVKWMYIPKDN